MNLGSSPFTPLPKFISPSGVRAPTSDAEEGLEDWWEVRSLSSSDNDWNSIEFSGHRNSINVDQTLKSELTDGERYTTHRDKCIVKNTDQVPMEVKEAHQSESSIEPVFGMPDGEDVLASPDFDTFLAQVKPCGLGFDFGPYPEEQPLYINAKQFHRILKRRMTRQKL